MYYNFGISVALNEFCNKFSILFLTEFLVFLFALLIRFNSNARPLAMVDDFTWYYNIKKNEQREMEREKKNSLNM